MAGKRQAKPIKLNFEPGVMTNLTDRDETNRWKDCDRVRWHKALPEKMLGWSYIPISNVNGTANVQYNGLARQVFDWSSLDGQKWIAIGTHTKLYLVNNGVLYDITPIRKASNVNSVISTTSASNVVRIADPDHRAEPGDFITIFNASAVGGLTLSGSFVISSVIDPDTYTIVAATNATSTAGPGGGSITIEYDIPVGLASNGERLGYGTGTYGTGTYGTPRTAGTGLEARLRIWSLDSWGEDLIASQNDGEIYWWDRSNGPFSRATLIAEAPTGVQRVLVNPENRFMIALGASSPVTGESDPMRVGWCDQENFRIWLGAEGNLAGGKRLDYGNRLITGIKSRKKILIWSDTQLYDMAFVGPTDVFGFDPLGETTIVGPNAAIDVNGVPFWWGFDDFFYYDGVITPLECDVWTHVMEDFDKSQSEKVVCAKFARKQEITWFYQSLSGSTHENDRYVTYNYSRSNPCWYYGNMARTFYRDGSKNSTGSKRYPMGANGGYLYTHEDQPDQIELSGTAAVQWFMESYDMNIGTSDDFLLINEVIPNFKSLVGNVSLKIKKKNKPHDSYKTRGPYVFSVSKKQINVRARGSQFAIRLEGSDLLQVFRMGILQATATPDGGRG
jgi:hypothetical protein